MVCDAKTAVDVLLAQRAAEESLQPAAQRGDPLRRRVLNGGSQRVAHCLHHTAKSGDLLAKRLIADAAEKGTDDNVTVLVVLLRPL